MRKILLVLIVALTIGACYNTYPGLVWINGHRINFWRFGNQYIETNCTARRPGWIKWTGGRVCVGGYIWFRINGRSGYCKVRKVKV